MERVNNEYYKGFEGEPEIQFICKKDDDSEILIIWEGYFDQIMMLIEPEADGWKGLAYYYNMYTGWYEESPWMVKDLHIALKQFEALDSKMIGGEVGEILKCIYGMLKSAILYEYEIFISRE